MAGTSGPTGRLTPDDVHLFNEGTHYRLYEKLGAHLIDSPAGVQFAVWAPNAQYVSVIGDFNNWDRARHPLRQRDLSGIWEGVIPGLAEGTIYKYHIASRLNGYTVDKADPFGFWHEVPPRTASVIRRLDYTWGDRQWMASRTQHQSLRAPISIYEVHLGSWMRSPADPHHSLGYRDLAPRLAEYARAHGFTHVELMPITEHPLFRSWGYQCTGYFAPTSRYGTPQDLMFLIDTLHQAGIGAILDWVPSHFPTDEHGLGYFDGTHLFEHADTRQGFHPEWKSSVFNYARHEVRAFLISSALFWLEKYHIDGLRVDAVASMLYLDYARAPGEWIPNPSGGRENLDAVAFLRQLNTEVYRSFPDVQTIAEESTSWPLVTRPVHDGGLGFGLKWDMGWMHDTLDYLKRDPIHRRHHHTALTFRGMYQHAENYVVPLSHDEVVHMKGSLLSRMPGDQWQRFANLRLLLTNQWLQPAKKLLFMGGEFGQWREWDNDTSLDWHLAAPGSPHAAIQRLVGELNRIYRLHPALHHGDCLPDGFEWISADDADHSIVAFLRYGPLPEDLAVAAFNYTPVPRPGYRLGVPSAGQWLEILNTDATEFGGSGLGNLGTVETSPEPSQNRPHTLTLTLPPLAAVLLVPAKKDARGRIRSPGDSARV